MTGIATFLVLLIILTAIVVHDIRKDKLYFDTRTWQIKEKNSADRTAEPLENYSHKYYITDGEEMKG